MNTVAGLTLYANTERNAISFTTSPLDNAGSFNEEGNPCTKLGAFTGTLDDDVDNTGVVGNGKFSGTLDNGRRVLGTQDEYDKLVDFLVSEVARCGILLLLVTVE